MSYSNIEHRIKPVWMKHRKWLLFLLSCILLAGMVGLINHLAHHFHTGRSSEKHTNTRQWIHNSAILSDFCLTLSCSYSVSLSCLSVGFSPCLHICWSLHATLWLLSVHMWIRQTFAGQWKATKKSWFYFTCRKPKKVCAVKAGRRRTKRE